MPVFSFSGRNENKRYFFLIIFKMQNGLMAGRPIDIKNQKKARINLTSSEMIKSAEINEGGLENKEKPKETGAKEFSNDNNLVYITAPKSIPISQAKFTVEEYEEKKPQFFMKKKWMISILSVLTILVGYFAFFFRNISEKKRLYLKASLLVLMAIILYLM